MVNDIKVIAPNQNLLVKFADDLTLSIPVQSGVSNSNSAANEVQSIVEWTTVNRMQLNFKKTWEMLLKRQIHQGLTSSPGFYRAETQSKVAGSNLSVRSV